MAMTRKTKLLLSILIVIANIIFISLINIELSTFENAFVRVFGTFIIPIFNCILVYVIIRYVWKIPSNENGLIDQIKNSCNNIEMEKENVILREK